MIELKDISKIYPNDVQALDNISLSFNKTGLIFIVGKSGNGKSTLLNVLGLLDDYSSGELIINNKNIKEYNIDDKNKLKNNFFGYIFQNYCLSDNLNVRDNIKLALANYDNKDEKIFDEVIDELGIGNLLDRSIKEISGGEAQRVAIARALVKSPSVLLCDEPTGNLDEENSKIVFDKLKRISDKRLVIVVSHDIKSALSYANRIIELDNGKIISDKIINNTLYKIDDKYLNDIELIKYLKEKNLDSYSLNIKKVTLENNFRNIEIDYRDHSTNVSNRFLIRFLKNVFKNHKRTIILKTIIMSLLLLIISILSCLIFYPKLESKIKYLENSRDFNFIVNKDIIYKDSFGNEEYKTLSNGNYIYSKLKDENIDINSVYQSSIFYNNKNININALTKNMDELSIEISDYIAGTYNISKNDTILFNSKELVVSNIFETNFKNYHNLINTNNIKDYDKKELIQNQFCYVIVNDKNLFDNSLYIPCSNFLEKGNVKQYSKTMCKIGYDKKLANNQIIVSNNYLIRNKYTVENIKNITFNFKNIYDNKFNNFYSDNINLYNYFDDFYITNVIDDNEYDYLISFELYNKILSDYNHIIRPNFFIVKNLDNKTINSLLKDDFKINDYNFKWLDNTYNYIHGLQFYLLIFNLVIILTYIILDILFVNLFYKSIYKDIGIFKSLGFEHRTIRKICNIGNLFEHIISILLCFIYSLIIYLIFIIKMKYTMNYNQIIVNDYSYINFAVYTLCILIMLAISFVKYKHYYKDKTINLIK